ncbi:MULTISPECIES: hypothetical protein [unclassified Streptomyces]|uniref:hypothetical protein n=1 Tax=unclassified Streptomyces TaxID=2593676 RepID=UPI0035D722C8
MTTAALPEHALTAAADLRAIREQWGDLLDAIEQRPADPWPPRECTGFLDQLSATQAAEDEPAIGRIPLTLRQHPAPANLDALDAAVEAERVVFGMCDTIAAQCQRPVHRRTVALRSTPVRVVELEDQADRDDPNRWTPAARLPGTPLANRGSRRYGLHWAAVWLEARALGEPSGDLFSPLDVAALASIAHVTRAARRRVEQALARAGRRTDLVDPCPWCGGQLLARTVPGGEPLVVFVVCETGEPCTAPVALDRGRRTWRGADLTALWIALHAARSDG